MFPRFFPFFARFHRLDEAVLMSPKPEPRAKRQWQGRPNTVSPAQLTPGVRIACRSRWRLATSCAPPTTATQHTPFGDVAGVSLMGRGLPDHVSLRRVEDRLLKRVRRHALRCAFVVSAPPFRAALTRRPLPRCAALRVHYSQPHIGHRFQPCAPPREPPRAHLLN
eukprot:COSAG04_NODE_2119_length_4751_cov_15.626397_3_plen_166_part_00